MEAKEFKVVFEKLSPRADTGNASIEEIVEIREIAAQSDEIAELSRLVAEMASPDPQLFTTT